MKNDTKYYDVSQTLSKPSATSAKVTTYFDYDKK